MNCWFCNLPIDDNQGRCDKVIPSPCRDHYVTYIHYSKGELFKVQMIGTIWNWNLDKEPRKYIVDYFVLDKMMTLTEQIELPRDPDDESPWISCSFKEVLKVPYTTPFITPTNFKEKLPLLLTFS